MRTLMRELRPSLLPETPSLAQALSRENILSYCGLLLANVFAGAFVLNRKFFLKDT